MPANSGSAPDKGVPLETLRAILDSPDFGGQKDGWGIRWKNPGQPKETAAINFSPWLETIRQLFAFALRLVLVAIIAGMAVFLLFRLHTLGREQLALKDKQKTKHLRITREESPDSFLEKARTFFYQGDMRLAWGFCAAAAIRSWPVYRGLNFPPDATEYDCVDMVRASAAEGHNEAKNFAVLINQWAAFAYGGRLPPEGSFEEALAFCEALRSGNG
jgi:hypothetical protein